MEDSKGAAKSSVVAKAKRIALQRLENLQRAGVEQIGRVKAPLSPTIQSIAAVESSADPLTGRDLRSVRNARSADPNAMLLEPVAAAAPRAEVRKNGPTTATTGSEQLLQELNDEVRACSLCRELACSRKQTVFGVGNPQPRVVFFGEAPGADEDRQGEPFVGRAGQLLTKIIEACGWQRSDVYIMNVLKCRPPDNRNPLPNEVENCRPFFERQFEILRPEYIVCVGTVPAQALLKTAEAVGKLRGRWHRYGDAKVLVTYHPSYLLRNPSAKKYVWDDMQVLLKEMGLLIPGKK